MKFKVGDKVRCINTDCNDYYYNKIHVIQEVFETGYRVNNRHIGLFKEEEFQAVTWKDRFGDKNV